MPCWWSQTTKLGKRPEKLSLFLHKRTRLSEAFRGLKQAIYQRLWCPIPSAVTLLPVSMVAWAEGEMAHVLWAKRSQPERPTDKMLMRHETQSRRISPLFGSQKARAEGPEDMQNSRKLVHPKERLDYSHRSPLGEVCQDGTSEEDRNGKLRLLEDGGGGAYLHRHSCILWKERAGSPGREGLEKKGKEKNIKPCNIQRNAGSQLPRLCIYRGSGGTWTEPRSGVTAG